MGDRSGILEVAVVFELEEYGRRIMINRLQRIDLHFEELAEFGLDLLFLLAVLQDIIQSFCHVAGSFRFQIRHQLYQTRLMRLPTSPEHVTYWYYEENKNLWYRKQHRQKKDF